MTRDEWIEKEVAEREKKMTLNVRNKSVLRSMLGKEHDFWEAQAVRVDNHTGHDDQ